MTTNVTGRIFDIQRFSLHDGPGIRTTVFMKGCPLHCIWCHNPESISPHPAVSFVPEKCIGCGYCFRVCPNGGHRMDPEKGHVRDRERCEACGLCTRECYSGALELVGRDATVEEVLGEVLRDTPFYETSGGGMTLSGGEPLQQTEFTEALLSAAKKAGLHCCVDTSGHAQWDSFERVIPFVDLFLYDYKQTDPDLHRKYTGASNELILANLRKLHQRGATVRLRCPIIPGLNDHEEHFAGIAALARELPGLEGVQIMPYNRLGESKLERLGLDATGRPHPPTPDEDTVNSWVTRLKRHGVSVLN